MGKFSKTLAVIFTMLLSFVLVGCGGDDAFSDPGATDDADATGSAQVASITLLVSTPTLGSASTSTVNLTAQVKDSNNNLIEGQSVVFSATGGGLLVGSDTTNASGVATATLSTAGDPTNRTITVSATAGGQTDSVVISVVNSTVTISGESSVVFGESTTLTIFVKDSAGNGVSGQTVTVSSANSNTLSATTLTTGTSGDVQVTLTGTNGGTDTITASALGATATYSISVSSDEFAVTLPSADLNIGSNHAVTVIWSQAGIPVADGQTVNFSATRGTLSAPTALTSGGTGTATVNLSSNTAGPVVVTASVTNGPSSSATADFVATTPASLNLQAAAETMGPDGQENLITAVVRDANGNLVKNVSVRFTIVQDASAGSISNATDTTDSLGRASTKYTSTAVTTATGGVVIRADVLSAGLSDTVAITVAQSDLFVRLGTGHLIETLDATRYKKVYNVLVTDSGGNASANVNVVVTLIPTYYHKGERVPSIDPDTFEDVAPMVADWSATCENEDTLNPDTALDGNLDTGEDFNNNGILDPGNVASVSGTVTTDSTGFALIDIIYSKDYADWTTVKLRASAQVQGSEGFDEAEFTLPVALADVNTLVAAVPGQTSPFGSAATCGDPN